MHGGGHSAEGLLVVFFPKGTIDDSIQRSPPHPASLKTATTAVRVLSNFSGLQINERPKSFQFEGTRDG